MRSASGDILTDVLRALRRQASRRRFLLTAGLASWTGLLPGCASSPEVVVQTYTEQVSTLLLSRDGRQLVVLGEQYHYVFAAPSELVELAKTTWKSEVTALIDPFEVSLDGRIHGQYTLVLARLPAGVTPQVLNALGFVSTQEGRWTRRGVIAGRRYMVGNTLREGRTREALPQTYTVTVRAQTTKGQQVADELSTPIVMTANGALLIYYALLAPVLLPVMYLSQEKREPLRQSFR